MQFDDGSRSTDAIPPDRHTPPVMTDYALERSRYRPLVPERFNAVVDIVEKWAAETPDALALVAIDGNGDETCRHSAASLASLARRAAQALAELGIAKGDRVFVMLPRSVEWYAAMLGAIRIGAVPMPTPNMLTSKDIAYRARRGSAIAIITDADGAAKIDRLPDHGSFRHRIYMSKGAAPSGWHSFDRLIEQADRPLPHHPTGSQDPLLVYFTSGTVGQPKMVEHDQSYALGHVATARFWYDLRPGDRHWTVSDTGWAKAAWGSLFGQWHARAAVVQVALGKPDSDLILSILAKHRITTFCAPPTLYRQLILADFSAHDLSALRHCTSAGEPLNPEVIRAWEEATGLTIHDGFGQTESTVLVANFRCNPVRPGSMGMPVPGYDVSVRDENGDEAATDVHGYVAVKCEPHPVGLFHGYADDADATEERFRDGYYYTGDRARVDRQGYFWFEGREDDVITSSAYRIGPFEVESVLIEHPAVIEAGVVGKPDPDRTEIVCAFVRLGTGHKASESLVRDIQNYVRSTTAPYKYPREIVFVTELPKTISGKIRRSELRRWLQSGIPADLLCK